MLRDKLEINNAMLRYLLYAALALIVILGMREASYLINMVIVSLILTMIGTPLFFLFKRHKMSDGTSVAAVMAIYAVVIAGFIGLIAYSMQIFIAKLPEYASLFNLRLSELEAVLSSHGLDLSMIIEGIKAFDISNLTGILVAIAGSMSSLFMDAFFIFIVTCFLFFELTALPKRLRALVGDDSLDSKYGEMCHSMIQWIVAKTKTNIVLGAAFGGMLYALGIDLALFWGVLAVILSYIPYIGLIIVSIPALVLAWLQLGLWGVIIVLIGICIINAVVENIVFAKFAEKDVNMPPLVVILSLILWTWVLGPIGMMLSVPITIMILIAFRYNDNLSWIPKLFGMYDDNVEGSEGQQKGKDGGQSQKESAETP